MRGVRYGDSLDAPMLLGPRGFVPEIRGAGFPPVGGATRLSQLRDVNETNPAAGDLLTYDGTDWVNEPLNSDASGVLPWREASGKYYGPNTFRDIGGTSTTTVALSSLRYVPTIIGRAISIDRIGIWITAGSTGGGGGLLRFGLYADHATIPGLPGALIVDGGTVSSEGAAGAREVTVAIAVAPGLYWLAIVGQVNVTSLAYVAYQSTSPSLSDVQGNPTLSTNTSSEFRTPIEAGVAGALPANASPSGYANNGPYVCYRAA